VEDTGLIFFFKILPLPDRVRFPLTL